MKAQRTLDIAPCLSVLTNEQIFEEISETGATFEDLHVDVLNHIWLRIQGESLIGVVQLKPIFKACYDCHIHILPDQRGHSKEAGQAVLDWCLNNLKGSTLTAKVPIYCGNVIGFLHKFGFEKTGSLKKAWSKGGARHDMILLSREV